MAKCFFFSQYVIKWVTFTPFKFWASCLFQKECLLFSFLKSGLFNSLPDLWVSETSAETLPYTNRSEPHFPTVSVYSSGLPVPGIHQCLLVVASGLPLTLFSFAWYQGSLSLLLLLSKMHQLLKMILKINLKKSFSSIFRFLAYLLLVSFHLCWNAVDLQCCVTYMCVCVCVCVCIHTLFWILFPYQSLQSTE